MFYWSVNTNCTDGQGNSICSDVQEGGTGASGGTGDLSPTYANCDVSTSPRTSQTYAAYLVPNSVTGASNMHWVFYIDAGGTAYVLDPYPYFQSSLPTGQVTVGISRGDPSNTQTYSTGPLV